MSLHVTSGSTLDTGHSSVTSANGLSPGLTTLPCTWRGTCDMKRHMSGKSFWKNMKPTRTSMQRINQTKDYNNPVISYWRTLCEHVNTSSCKNIDSSGTMIALTAIQYNETTIDYTVILAGVLDAYYSDIYSGQRQDVLKLYFVKIYLFKCYFLKTWQTTT